MPNPVGRPTDYTQELADEMCSLLAEGKSARTVCAMKGMPCLTTFFKWLRLYPEFVQQYEQARKAQMTAFSEDIVDIADDDTGDVIELDGKMVINHAKVQRDKLRCDNRKWLMSKLDTKKYGDKKEEEQQKVTQVIITREVLKLDEKKEDDD